MPNEGCYSEENVKKVLGYTYMTDAFMNRAANPEIAREILSIIFGHDVAVDHVQHQLSKESLYAKGCRFDVYATDRDGCHYDVEVQNENPGANERRARYNTSCMDDRFVQKGSDYSEFPNTFVVFITQEDYLGKGLPIYHVRRIITETGERFEDGQEIIYVNGANTHDDTPLSQLMRDMQQSDPDKIKNPILANRMRLLKKGVYLEDMCKELTQERNQGRQEGLKEGLNMGRKEGLDAGIRGAILLLAETGMKPDAVVKKIAAQYSLSSIEAKNYYNEVLNA